MAREKCNDPSLIGKKYGRLTIIGFSHLDKGYHHGWGWDCKCDCGKIVYGKRPNMVKSGEVLSCGCLKIDQNRSNLNKRKTHGKSNHRLYDIWEKMRGRCNKEYYAAYKNYGGRGIKVCDEWDNDFESFYTWAMGNGYEETLTIERIDVNKGYSPDNCCWIPREDQAKNRRGNIYVEVDGVKMPLKTACEKLGMPYKAVHLRITRRGWDIDRALHEPIYDRENSLSSKCKKLGLPYSTIASRIQSGWDEERALTTPVKYLKRKKSLKIS